MKKSTHSVGPGHENSSHSPDRPPLDSGLCLSCRSLSDSAATSAGSPDPVNSLFLQTVSSAAVLQEQEQQLHIICNNMWRTVFTTGKTIFGQPEPRHGQVVVLQTQRLRPTTVSRDTMSGLKTRVAGALTAEEVAH